MRPWLKTIGAIAALNAGPFLNNIDLLRDGDRPLSDWHEFHAVTWTSTSTATGSMAAAVDIALAFGEYSRRITLPSYTVEKLIGD